MGELSADARLDLEMHHRRLTTADVELPLRAPMAINILNVAVTMCKVLEWTPASEHVIENFRALLDVCVNNIFSAALRRHYPA
jgi:hypothetical protein